MRQPWSTSDQQKLRLAWDRCSREQIEAMFPDRSWRLISVKAHRLKLNRRTYNAITRTRHGRTKDPIIATLAGRRELLGLTQEQLAKTMEISGSAISLYEKDKPESGRHMKCDPSLRLMRKWCAALGLELCIREITKIIPFRTLPEWYDSMEVIDNTVILDGRISQKLTKKERETFFTLGPDYMSHERIHFLLYGDGDHVPDLKVIDVYISKLRKKLRSVGIVIQNAFGEGYRLQYQSPGQRQAA